MKRLSTTLFIISLMLLPLAIVFENQAFSTWSKRLAIPELESLPNRHTPKHFTGTFLPPLINKNTTLSVDDNPIILTSKTHVQPGTTLTLKPGTHLYANENASLSISGQLIAKGFQNQPILFSSNEKHPLNQTWLGISVMSGGAATIEHTFFEDASPAISCLTESEATVSNSKITKTVMGVFITSHKCSIRGTVIRSLQNGIIVVNANPTLLNNVITAKKDKVKKVDTNYRLMTKD